VKKVVGSDGTYLGDPSEKDFREIVEEAALKRFPEPTPWGLASEIDGGVEKIVVWAASLFVNGEETRLPAFSTWEFGLPIQSVLGVLNELAAEGWAVTHVSEDRGIYGGTTNRTDSATTRARYLLMRDSQP